MISWKLKLPLVVIIWMVESTSSSRVELHSNDIRMQDSSITTEDPLLLPEVIEPQVPVFFPERSGSEKSSKTDRSGVFRWGDIKALMLEGYIIPIVTPEGPPPHIFPPAGDLNITEGQDILEGMPETLVTASGKSVHPGIKMEVSGSDPMMCGNYEMRSGTKAMIQTPYFPDKYANNFRCRWIITALDGDKMMVNCPEFQLAKGDQFITAIEGKPETQQKYKLKTGPVNQVLEATTIRLLFVSNRRKNSQGFSCSVTVIGNTAPSTSTSMTTEMTTERTTTTTKPITTTPKTTTTSTTTTTTTTEAPPSTTTTPKAPITTTTTGEPTTSLPPLSHPDCGITNRPTNRIVNGQAATSNEYPWQSFLEIDWSDGKSQLCGGSLITKQWILTAGHCVLRQRSNGDLWIPEVKVTLGMHTRTNPLGNGGIKFTAADVIIHPKNNFAFDLALIKLPQEVEYKREIRPVCLPNRYLHGKNVTGVLMALIGWGKTETGKLTTELRELSRYGIESAICQKVFGSYITSHHFCTSGTNVKHICLGDSGGPVMTVNRGRFTLTGVVSFVATADCKGEYPDGHISVTHFLDWIESHTKHTIY